MTSCRECGLPANNRGVHYNNLHGGLCWPCEKRHLDAARPRRMSYGQLLRWASDCPYILDGRRCLEPARHGIVHRLENHPAEPPETPYNARRRVLGGNMSTDKGSPFIPAATGEAE